MLLCPHAGFSLSGSSTVRRTKGSMLGPSPGHSSHRLSWKGFLLQTTICHPLFLVKAFWFPQDGRHITKLLEQENNICPSPDLGEDCGHDNCGSGWETSADILPLPDSPRCSATCRGPRTSLRKRNARRGIGEVFQVVTLWYLLITNRQFNPAFVSLLGESQLTQCCKRLRCA